MGFATEFLFVVDFGTTDALESSEMLAIFFWVKWECQKEFF